MNQEETVRAAYEAYNRRRLDAGLAQLHPNVRWDDGEGRMLRGREVVARHRETQWRSADARVDIRSIRQDGPILRLAILLKTQAPGQPPQQRELENDIAFLDGLIAVMRIPAAASDGADAA
jgi:hypothetical protein